MRINSNIAKVVAQTERLIQRIPDAAKEALEPRHWQADARDVAMKTLVGLANPQDRQHVNSFVATVSSVLENGELVIRMRTPATSMFRMGGAVLSDARSARAAVGADVGNNLFRMEVQRFEELLAQWVEGEKERDARDLGKTDEDITHLMSYILLTPNPGEKAKQARAKLEPHILAYIMRQQAGSSLAPQTASEWLRAVLAGWRVLVVTKYPGLVRQALRSPTG